ncbi:hypothetical protein L1987_18337 [Smallanthus sonchifolius]|uniref:Uncharacterized protein n=1 Tax=Smallanthus sonchifolius TaxID=185202 RepID=A0ACB9IZA8_9ASTR|nr:hypothetical protein L1987_18337 [Smallanthus sonchifolius]
METPTSSSRRITASQALAMKSRSALIDITNDSPIVGLSIGNMKTPSSTFYKKTSTPGSGEALLRDQVKTLLQKVEEEAVIKKITFEPISFKLDQQEETEETAEKKVVTKLLFADFPEESEGCDSSLDDESVWSVEVNASTRDENEDDDLCEVMIKICGNGSSKGMLERLAKIENKEFLVL